MSSEVISVVAVPQDTLDHFYKISKMLDSSLFHLDEAHIPHVTLAQFIAPYDALGELKKQCKVIDGKEVEITTAGINFVPDTLLYMTWIELLVLKSAILLEIQRQVLCADFAKKYELQNWGVGDTYRPHITIGALKGTSLIPSMNIDGHQDTVKGTFRAKIKIGKNGKYFSFTG